MTIVTPSSNQFFYRLKDKMDELDPNTSGRVRGCDKPLTNSNDKGKCPDVQEDQTQVTSASKESKDNNKENKGFMKRILGGRHLKTSKSTTSCTSFSDEGGNKLGKVQEASFPKSNAAQPSANQSRKVLGNYNGSMAATQRLVPSNPRTRQQLSRSQLLPGIPSSPASSSQTYSPRGEKRSTMANAETLPPIRKNFVKANMLAAASTKVKSTVHLEVPKSGGNLSQSGKRLGGSSRSLNSEPGVSVTLSPASSSFRRGTVDQQRRTLHNISSRPSNIGSSATLGRNSVRSKNPKEKVAPSSQNFSSKSSNRDRRKSKSPRASLSAGVNGAVFSFDQLSVLNTEESSSANTSRQVSRRSSFNGVDSEIIKSLKQKQEHFQLMIENLQTDICDLRTSLELAEQRNVDLEKKLTQVTEESKLKLEESKNEMKDYFLGMLEIQRSEMRDEIRKLLSFKDSSQNSHSPSVNESTEGKTKSFKQSKEKLFSKIHRLSARMSMQDLDMKVHLFNPYFSNSLKYFYTGSARSEKLERKEARK